MAKVSVVMCCYNSERYIKETIDSVLNQTFSDFEFIIWNDGSTDTTEDIILAYKDDRIKYFKDINRGEGMAAQLACRHATGKYIARIDSDDVWFPEKLELQYGYMESHPHTVMMSCPVIYIDKDSNELGLSFPITKTSYLNKSIKTRNLFPHSGSMYREEVYQKVGGYDNVRFFQDMLLFWKLSDYGDLALWPRPLMKYRLLGGSVAHRIENSEYKEALFSMKDIIYREKGTNKKVIEVYNSIYDLIEKKSEEFVYKDDIQNKVFKTLSKLFGRDRAYGFMTFMKNLWYR